MTRYYAPDYIHEDGDPSNGLCEKYVYLADDVVDALPSREQIEQLKTLARIIRRFSAACELTPTLGKDADAIDAAVVAFEMLGA